jgi:hypothetical protein
MIHRALVQTSFLFVILVSIQSARADTIDEISEIVLQFEDARSVIKIHERMQIRKLRSTTIKQLRQIQDMLTQANQLDGALTVRDAIEKIKLETFGNPGLNSVSHSNSTPSPSCYMPFVLPVAELVGPFAMPEDAAILLTGLEAESTLVEQEYKSKIRAIREEAIAPLKTLQSNLSQSGQLSPAVQARDAIQYLSKGYLHPVKIKSSLMELQPVIGKTYFIEITGRNEGSIYGTDYFTADSNVPSAAVHSGLVQVGETTVLKLIVLSAQTSFLGSNRHAVASSNYGPYWMAYKLERTDD